MAAIVAQTSACASACSHATAGQKTVSKFSAKCEASNFGRRLSSNFLRRLQPSSANQRATFQRSLHVSCAVSVKESYGAASMKGLGRAIFEDFYFVGVDASGEGPSFFGVFDGHGGPNVAEFLKNELWNIYKKNLAAGSDPLRATEASYLEADAATLAPPKGLFGALRERGMGGSKCGATAATVVLLPGATWRILAANVGDARTVLSRGGKAVQLSVDHKPDVEAERLRIEKKNPTPKKPLVQYAGGAWRVGGLLALSRAFGDVYLKDWSDGVQDGARGGFGLTAEPSVSMEDLAPGDEWLIIASDGLWDSVPNQEAVDVCREEENVSPDALAAKLMKLAVSRGATDDITVVVVKLPKVD